MKLNTNIASWGMGLVLLLSSCHTTKNAMVASAPSYHLADASFQRIEIDASLDAAPNPHAVDLLNYYKKKVDKATSPIIGKSARSMKSKFPESELSNLVSDALRWGAQQYLNEPVDIAVLNFGGIRTTLPEGDVTIGNIIEITPFENMIYVYHVKGDAILRLFQQLCEIKDGALSGAQIVCKGNQLQSALVGGETVNPDKTYTLAALDYIAEGNDDFSEFKQWKNPIVIKDITMRHIFLDFVEEQTRQGKVLDSKIEGRFTIEK